MKISLTCVYMYIYYCLLSTLFHVLYTSVHAYKYSGDAIYWNIYGLLIGYQLYHGGCAICPGQILYYTHNIFLLLTKQKLEFIHGDSNMIKLKQMIMYINWLM